VGKPLIVVCLIDALGWEIAARFGFCRDLLEHRAPLDTVLGYSSAAIPSLLSGTTPSQHGAWAMWRLAGAGGSPFGYLRHLPKLPHALEWRARYLVKRITDYRRAIEGYYDLYEIPVHLLGRFDVSQHQDPYLPGGLNRETIFDRLVADGVPYRMWYYRTPERDNMAALLDSTVRSGRGNDANLPDLLFLYTAELDALMHRVGIFHEAVVEKLLVYERFLADVIERGKAAGRDISVYLLSDHGMADVHDTFDLWGEVEKRGLEVGRDYLAFYDSTMARLWCDDRTRAEVAGVLSGAGVGRELADDELESYGCLFEDRAYGNAIFLANPGVMFVPSFMGRARVAAMHGYDPEDAYSKGCFLTNDGTAELPRSILDFKSYLMGRVSEVLS
jgi:hypothetical protein